jgi:hypothetical protein
MPIFHYQEIVDEGDHSFAVGEDLGEVRRRVRPPLGRFRCSNDFWKAFRIIVIGFCVVTLIHLIFRLLTTILKRYNL